MEKFPALKYGHAQVMDMSLSHFKPTTAAEPRIGNGDAIFAVSKQAMCLGGAANAISQWRLHHLEKAKSSIRIQYP